MFDPSWVQVIQECLWSLPLLLFLFGTGLFLTVRFRGLQFRYLVFSLKQLFHFRDKKPGDLSPFNALMTSLAGAIGTGTIVGVGTAIAIGGLGALFWMWVSAFLGMATKFAESHLAVHFRIQDPSGEMCGGPMHYMERGLGWKKTAAFFAIFAIFAALTTGNLVQANAIGEALNEMCVISPYLVAIALAFITGVIILGGVQSIGKASGVLVPFMAFLYLGAGGYILIEKASLLPETLFLIIQRAFYPEAIFGGASGGFLLAFQMGLARSVFSNEAGLGISSIASASAKTDHPVRQALVSMTGVLFSTLIICSMTGLVVALHLKDLALFAPLNPARLVMMAFQQSLTYGSHVVSLGLVFFAFSTILAWGYYGEKCVEYLFGNRMRKPFRLLFTLTVIPGALLPLELVWQLADISNALLVIPNLFALIALSHLTVSDTEQFLLQHDLEPAFSTIA